ncbi:DNA-binding protein HEXBP, partial [Tanacetum coccineum]
VGHIGRIMSRCNGDVNGDMEGFVGHYSAICYYCGKGGYIAVCSKCGETGHMGKEYRTNRWCIFVVCYICGKNGHKAKECCGVGCYKCGKVGHIGRIMSRCNGDVNGDMEGFVGHYSAICYYCGKGGYIAVCSKCGETGHMGKECC